MENVPIWAWACLALLTVAFILLSAYMQVQATKKWEVENNIR